MDCAATLPETRMKAAAASLLVTLVHCCFDLLHAAGEFSYTGIGGPINSSG